MTLYIVLRTTRHSNCQENRKTILVTPSLDTAKECVLDDYRWNGEYGYFPEKDHTFIDGVRDEQSITIDEERSNHDGLTLKCAKDFRHIEVLDTPDPSDWDHPEEYRLEWEIEEWQTLTPASLPKWDILYDEEHPDSNGCCCVGVLSDKTAGRCLFFTVSADEPGACETCRVYNSITFDDSTLECEFAWTAENERRLLAFLDGAGEHYCGDGSEILDIVFEPAPPRPYAECLVRFKDETVQEKRIFKLSTDTDPQDEKIFFHCDGLEALKSLASEDNGEDFVVLDYRLLESI